MKKQPVFYSLSYVCQYLGISPHLLRAWEKRYQCIHPKRKSNGRRVYTEDEIIHIAYLFALTCRGHQISDLAPLSINELKKLHGKEIEIKRDKKTNETPKATIHALLLALEHYNLEIIDHELKQLKEGQPLLDLVYNYLLPLIQKLGEKVYKKELGIEQEHALTSLIRSHFYSEISHTIKRTSLPSRRYILSTPEGELHEFGILLAALILKAQGQDFYYLGTNLPAKSLVLAQRGLKSDTIIIGSSINYAQDAKQFKSYIKELEQLPPHVEVIIGGYSPIKLKGRFVHLKELKSLPEWIRQKKN